MRVPTTPQAALLRLDLHWSDLKGDVKSHRPEQLPHLLPFELCSFEGIELLSEDQLVLCWGGDCLATHRRFLSSSGLVFSTVYHPS